MSYSNEEAFDMLLALGECRGTFATAKDCGGNVILIRLLTRKTFFHVWLNESLIIKVLRSNSTSINVFFQDNICI